MTADPNPQPTAPALKNDLFIRACFRRPVERTPVWIMRQAGRYLPEYRALRAKVDFLTSCRTPGIACEITLQPIRRLGVDAAILFSDILLPLPGMGMPIEFDPGPKIEDPVRSRAAVEALRTPDAREATPYVLDAVRLIRRELAGTVPLIGFAGAPFTMATYLVEGGGSKSFGAIKSLLFCDPGTAHVLLSKCADTIASYLCEQVRAGAQAAMLFDTWAGILSPADYRAFALPYARRVFDAVGRAAADSAGAGASAGRGGAGATPGAGGSSPFPGVPRIYYAGEAAGYIEAVAEIGAEVAGLDWRMGLAAARRRLGAGMAVQGNLDPCALFGPRELIERRAREVLLEAKGIDTLPQAGAGGAPEAADAVGAARVPGADGGEPRGSRGPSSATDAGSPIGAATGHVFNLGHGILPETPPDHALFLVETVRRLTSGYRA
jgi:uroporphyrinogen decarboxylase